MHCYFLRDKCSEGMIIVRGRLLQLGQLESHDATEYLHVYTAQIVLCMYTPLRFSSYPPRRPPRQ